MNITFDPANDVDDLVNASVKRLNTSAVQLDWHQIRNVDGYIVRTRLPPEYAVREPVTTKATNITRKCFFVDIYDGLYVRWTFCYLWMVKVVFGFILFG